MVCGGFACSKNALCALNVVYMLVGLLLIGVAAWGKGLGVVSIIGGVIAVGVFLLLIAVAGLVGAVNHHQVLLFFYMIILGLVFIFQFGISCSCLAINRSKQISSMLLGGSWATIPGMNWKEVLIVVACSTSRPSTKMMLPAMHSARTEAPRARCVEKYFLSIQMKP
ncbi:tetraspanin-31 isoform X2 [Heterocephalus glaber]|uniref:Tetraspanin-31 isoform X2 n=1 Tax=Heterocephalus glaber TaxID=10181 RepID=A0AAX6PVP8_HETGA|nr:tetraspanin-31 isoform X2 [Heterocephalus glaber]